MNSFKSVLLIFYSIVLVYKKSRQKREFMVCILTKYIPPIFVANLTQRRATFRLCVGHQQNSFA